VELLVVEVCTAEFDMSRVYLLGFVNVSSKGFSREDDTASLRFQSV
jgi:hypothetical protein